MIIDTIRFIAYNGWPGVIMVMGAAKIALASSIIMNIHHDYY
jgi:hypothetical protein